MLVIDASVLLRAHRSDAPEHHSYRHWLQRVLEGDTAFAIPDVVMVEFLRLATHPRVFDPPTGLDVALDAAKSLREQPHFVNLEPGARHFQIFARLCHEAGVKGPLMLDAQLAALVIENGGELITTDRGFRRFPDLNFRHPLG